MRGGDRHPLPLRTGPVVGELQPGLHRFSIERRQGHRRRGRVGVQLRLEPQPRRRHQQSAGEVQDRGHRPRRHHRAAQARIPAVRGRITTGGVAGYARPSVPRSLYLRISKVLAGGASCGVGRHRVRISITIGFSGQRQPTTDAEERFRKGNGGIRLSDPVRAGSEAPAAATRSVTPIGERAHSRFVRGGSCAIA